jgi:Family of unknown function (DUF5677)
MVVLGHSVPNIKRVEVDPAALASFTKEGEFTSLAVSLMVETASYCCIAAGTLGPSKAWDRNKAAVAGNMVRQYKLLDAFLDQVCKHRDETGMILARLVFETTVNIRFLIKNFSPSLINSYVTHSLRHERKLRDSIRKNIEDRRGIIQPIEDRMLRSIERAAKVALVDLDQIDLKDKRPWGGKNTFDKTRDVGLEGFYLAAFGGGSHSIHGNWHEIYSNHLEWDEITNEFTPQLHWKRPRPQVITSFALVIAETVKLYFQFIGGDELSDYFDPLLDSLHDRVHDLVRAHENYLSAKAWPET